MRFTVHTFLPLYLVALLNIRILGKSIRRSAGAVPPSADPEKFLERYGYLFPVKDNENQSQRSDSSPEVFAAAVAKYQKFIGIPVTGAIDARTREEMNKLRCGTPDFRENSTDAQARFVLSGRRWANSQLGWYVNKVEGTSYSRSLLQNLVARALQEWANPSQLTFSQTSPGFAALVVDFVLPDAQGNHGDGAPFGQSDLGHAFYPGSQPLDGDLHMNMLQTYYISYYSNYNPFASDLYFVVVHELGHSLGLDHTSVNTAVMFPSLSRGRSYGGLTFDDVAAIQTSYGANPFYSDSPSMMSSLIILLFGLFASFTLSK